MDYFTKWVEFIAMPNHTAKMVAKVFTRIGVPRFLHSHQGTDFLSGLFSETCLRFGIKKTRTTPWRTQSDGMVERMNRTLGTMLRQYVNEQQTDWDEWLPHCAMAYNSSRHSTTGCTPTY